MTKPLIPFFSLERQTKKISAEILEAFAHILHTQQFIGGPLVENFEKKMAHYLGVEHVVSCNSGTDGILIALKALDVKKDTIVLTTPFSFIASASEIAALEAHPFFIDIDPKTLNIDPKKIELWLEKNTKIINGITIHMSTNMPVTGMVIVDIFGQAADFDAIKKISRTWNLWIIEDACQAIGTELHGKKTGTFGDISVFSFYPTKNLGAFGDAGCCSTNDAVLAQKLTKLKNHGRSSHYNYEELGINSRMDTLQASALSIKLDHIDTYNKRRRQIAAIYNEQLKNCSFLELPQELNGTHTYHQYCVIVAQEMRQIFQDYMKNEGVGTAIYYPKPLNEIPFLQTHSALTNETPITHNTCKNIVALPIWPELSDDEILYICDTIKGFQTYISHQTEKVVISNAF